MSGGHPWIPGLNDNDRRRMLSAIGVSDPLELYRDVPRDIILEEPPRIGFGDYLSEWEVERLIRSYASKNRLFLDPPPFLGGGVCFHHVPALVKHVVLRNEFYTAYTPYQPEINQGLLQALYEYQSLMAEILELDVVNASLYDMSTAVAEAMLLALRVTRRKRVVIAGKAHPEHVSVAKTWLYGKGMEVIECCFDEEKGGLSLEALQDVVDADTAAVYVQNPSFYGTIIDTVEEVADIAHRKGALFIVGVDVLSLGLIKPPGRYGADVAVAEGQPLGLGLNYGGPYLGVFAVRWDRRLVRQLPGRLIGKTRTIDGSREGYAMILQTREQHIRREKATSNITTNEALMAIAAAVYVSLLGGHGLRELARTIWLKSHYAAKKLAELPGVKVPLYKAEFFKEFVARFRGDYTTLYRRLLVEKGVLGGLPLAKLEPRRSTDALFCVTEAHSMRDIDRLVRALGELL